MLGYVQLGLLYASKGWCDEFDSRLNIIIGIVQKMSDQAVILPNWSPYENIIWYLAFCQIHRITLYIRDPRTNFCCGRLHFMGLIKSTLIWMIQQRLKILPSIKKISNIKNLSNSSLSIWLACFIADWNGIKKNGKNRKVLLCIS